MKKDKKFLEDLASFLGDSKYKEEIISKYDNLIKSEKAAGKKIKYILKDLGDPELIANEELKSYEKNNSFSVFDKIKSSFLSLKEKINFKNDEDKLSKDADKVRLKEEKKKIKEEKRIQKEIDKLNKEEKKSIFDSLKEKLKLDLENKKEDTKKSNKDKKKDKNKKNNNKKSIQKKNLFESLKEKLKPNTGNKEDKKKDNKKENKKEKSVSFIDTLKIKLADYKVKREKSKIIKDKEKEEARKEKEKNKIKKQKEKEKESKPKKEKVSLKNRINNLFKKKEREVTDTPQEIIEEVKEEVEDKIGDVTEIVTETHVFESKSKRFRRFILKTLGVIITCILAFVWLWVSVVFFASVFAYLDGIKFIGIVIAAFSVDLLIFWIVIMVNRAIFKKKMSLVLNIIIVFLSLAGIAYGSVKAFKEISAIEHIEDVSDKYTMTRKLETYDLSKDTNEKFIVTFNSNYDTQYVIKYDKNLKNKVKIETRYYECYYDYYVKTNVNGVYVSLGLDNRDRFSVYMDDIKEGKIYDNDELARYTVKITVNPNDADRIAIQ